MLIVLALIDYYQAKPGFRLLNLANLSIIERTDEETKEILKKNIEIDNIQLVNGEIELKSGSLNGYEVIKYDRVDNRSRHNITIIGEIDSKYLVSDIQGNLTLYDNNLDKYNGVLEFNTRYRLLTEEEIFNTNSKIKSIHKSMLKYNMLGIDKLIYNINKLGVEFTDREYKFSKVCVPNVDCADVEFSFIYDKEITSILISKGITEIKAKALYMCSNIEEINLPYTLVRIESEALAFCGAREITIPQSVKSIGYNCFRGCRKLNTIKIPKHLMENGDTNRVFYGIEEKVDIEVY